MTPAGPAESSAQTPPLLVAGRIGRPHGLRGELSVLVVGDDPARLATGAEVWLETPGGDVRRARIASSRRQGNRLLLRFDGVDSREQAAKLVGGDVSVPYAPDSAPQGSYYPTQLQGLRVLTRGGTPIGTVAGVVFAPAREYLEVLVEGRREPLLVPFHADIVRDVDLTRGDLTIDPPEGLLDL